MNIETLPIGTVIRDDRTMAMIVGHEFVEKNKKLEFFYVILPYPFGYQQKSDLKRLPEGDYEVVHLGMRSDLQQAMCDLYSCIRMSANSMNAEEILDALRHMNDPEEREQ